jgi:hypothetical protein
MYLIQGFQCMATNILSTSGDVIFTSPKYLFYSPVMIVTKQGSQSKLMFGTITNKTKGKAKERPKEGIKE